ncbi:MAG: hypothetical protein KAH38_08365, partial [Candidatus Hydrogenedentes bacterium]|nr:hypothetical protein [Candidatus Hydrogenedentota bacterium]
AGTTTSYVNWVENNDNAAIPAAGFANMDATGIAPEYKDSPWRGKLKIPLMPAFDGPVLGAVITRVLTDSGLSDSGDWYRDFECDLRSSLAKAQVGADQVDPTPMSCPVNSVGATQQPHLPTDTWTAHHSNTDGIYVMEETPNVEYGTVSYITWWGIWKDAGGIPCAPPNGAATEFEVETYGVHPNFLLITPTGTELTDYKYNGVPLYKYEYAFDRDEFRRDQYISIRAVSTGPCYFYWISSADGGNEAVDQGGAKIGANLSLCMSEYNTGDECAPNSILFHPPVHMLTPGVPALKSNDISPVYEQLDNGPIDIVEFWGVWLTDEATPGACIPPSDLGLEFMRSADLVVAPTPVSGNFHITAAPVIGGTFIAPNGDLLPMYRYAFTADSEILSGEWISIQQLDAASQSCYFYWVESNFGSNQAV